MIAIQNVDNISTGSEMPNFVIWSWMRTSLGLSGCNLMLFAYIYSQSFDNLHHTETSLSSLSEWFGISRQTLSRNIDKLPYVKKEPSRTHPSGFYGFFYYRVDVDLLLNDFRKRNDDSYHEFLLSYRQLLILKFPDDEKSIQDYFKVFLDWHAGLDSRVLDKANTIIALGNDIKNEPEKSYEGVNFAEALTNMQNQIESLTKVITELTNNSKNVEIIQTVEPSIPPEVKPSTNITKHRGAKKPSDLGIVAKPVKSTKPTTREEKERIKRENLNRLVNDLYMLNTDFVTTHNITDERILNSLNSYVYEIVEKENNPKGLTTFKYKESLKQLSQVLSLDDMRGYIEDAIIGSYAKFIYDTDKLNKLNRIESNKRKIWQITENFIKKFPEADEEFSNTIREYVENCIIGEWTPFSFDKRMKVLLDQNLTSEQVITVLTDTVAAGWKQWNFTSISNSSSTNVMTNNFKEVEMKEKESVIDDFFRRHYFYQTPEVREKLLSYIHECDNGRCVSAKDLDIKLEYLLQHRFLVADIVAAIEDATSHNYPDLCVPDYKQEERVKKSYGTLTRWVESSDSYRRKYCEEARRDNPNDPRFEGMGLDWVEENMLRNYGRVLE